MKNTAAVSFSAGELGIYTRYSEQGASSRLRYYLYRQAFEESGFSPRYYPLLDDGYLHRLYSGKGKSGRKIISSLVKRFFSLFSLEHDLLIEYELCPLLPAWLELLFIGKRKYVLNFDDLVWEKYKNIPVLRGKFDKLISRASGVIAANHLLYDKIKKLNPRVLLTPTVVDLDHYRQAEIKEKSSLQAAWIGTPVTFRECFLPHAETFRKVCQETDLSILIIAKKELPAVEGINMTCVDWTRETEAQLLASCDIGIMPLADDDFSRGKSAYKLIQYAAAGLPAIASPVGENKFFIRQGINGFSARTADEWIQAVKALSSAAEREKFSRAIREKAYDYSLQKHAPEVTAFLKECFS